MPARSNFIPEIPFPCDRNVNVCSFLSEATAQRSASPWNFLLKIHRVARKILAHSSTSKFHRSPGEKIFQETSPGGLFPLRFPRYVDSICTERSKLNRENTRSNERRSRMSASCLGTGWINLPSERSLRTSRRKGNEYRRVVGSAEIAPGKKKKNGREWRDSDEARSFAKTIVEWCGQSAVTNFPRIIRTCTTARNNALPSWLSSFELLLYSILTTDF